MFYDEKYNLKSLMEENVLKMMREHNFSMSFSTKEKSLFFLM